MNESAIPRAASHQQGAPNFDIPRPAALLAAFKTKSGEGGRPGDQQTAVRTAKTTRGQQKRSAVRRPARTEAAAARLAPALTRESNARRRANLNQNERPFERVRVSVRRPQSKDARARSRAPIRGQGRSRENERATSSLFTSGKIFLEHGALPRPFERTPDCAARRRLRTETPRRAARSPVGRSNGRRRASLPLFFLPESGVERTNRRVCFWSPAERKTRAFFIHTKHE